MTADTVPPSNDYTWPFSESSITNYVASYRMTNLKMTGLPVTLAGICLFYRRLPGQQQQKRPSVKTLNLLHVSNGADAQWASVTNQTATRWTGHPTIRSVWIETWVAALFRAACQIYSADEYRWHAPSIGGQVTDTLMKMEWRQQRLMLISCINSLPTESGVISVWSFFSPINSKKKRPVAGVWAFVVSHLLLHLIVNQPRLVTNRRDSP